MVYVCVRACEASIMGRPWSKRPLRRADHLPRKGLTGVVYLSVCVCVRARARVKPR